MPPYSAGFLFDLFFESEDGSHIFLRNFGLYLNCRASQSRTRHSSPVTQHCENLRAIRLVVAEIFWESYSTYKDSTLKGASVIHSCSLCCRLRGFVSCFWCGFMSGWPKSEMLLVVTLKYSFSVLQKQVWIYYPTKRQLSVLCFEKVLKGINKVGDVSAIYAGHQDKFLNMFLGILSSKIKCQKLVSYLMKHSVLPYRQITLSMLK
jgi:hypothetical protein